MLQVQERYKWKIFKHSRSLNPSSKSQKAHLSPRVPLKLIPVSLSLPKVWNLRLILAQPSLDLGLLIPELLTT
jgi:hypothetical protein